MQELGTTLNYFQIIKRGANDPHHAFFISCFTIFAHSDIKLDIKDACQYFFIGLRTRVCYNVWESDERNVLLSCQTRHQLKCKGWKLRYIFWDFQINAKRGNQTNAFLKESEAYQFSCFPGSSSSVEEERGGWKIQKFPKLENWRYWWWSNQIKRELRESKCNLKFSRDKTVISLKLCSIIA